MKKVIRKHYKLAFFLCMMLLTIVMGTSAMAENGTWYLSHTVDEFGDESGNPVIQSEITGTFSNTATAESELKVMAYIVSDDTGTIVGEGKYVLAFRLFEYGDHVATYLSSDSKILKTKIGDTVTEYDLSGSAPNGDLYVDVNASVSSLKTKEDIDNFINGKTSNYGEEIAKQPKPIDVYEDYYLDAHYTEYPVMTQEELENTFSGQYIVYGLGVPARNSVGVYVTLGEDGNVHLLGYYEAETNSFQSREDFNPNYEEIRGSWKIEDGKLTLPGIGIGDTYEIRDTGYKGYYLMCSWLDKKGMSNYPGYLIVAVDDNRNYLYDLPEESANSNDSNDSDSNNIQIDNKMINYINENGTYDENITLRDQGGENSFSGYCFEFVPEGATEASTWKFYTNADQANGFWYENTYSSEQLNVNMTIYFLYPKKEMKFIYYYEVPDGWTDTNGNKYDFRGTFYLTMPIESYKNGQTFSADVEVLEYLDNADNEWKRIDTTQKMGDSAITTGLSSLIEQLQIFLEKDTDISMSDLGFTLEE